MPQRVFVGDIQGCSAELEQVVDRAERTFGDDFELWLVGDTINRGPDNLGVLERVHALWERGRAHVVLGNHEIGLILKWLGIAPLKRSDTVRDVLESPHAARWIDWLRRLPLALAGEVAGEPFVMVHAAVHPDWSRSEVLANAASAAACLATADRDTLADFLSESRRGDPVRDALERITRCRSVAAGSRRGRATGATGGWFSDPPEERADSEPWHAAWRRREHAYGVVYGHWAKDGLRVERGLRGLDTGCVYHAPGDPRRLTAWVPDDAAGFVDPDARFWFVRPVRPPQRANDTEM